ncbi:hypothetical protein U9R90_05175 [Streptomyces sp. E11-3]|uniref:hypothetical protein n=1 Tax=Streptomyces sp. E11-3 TaxID=3110112 RepID=UPI00398004C0
MTTAPERMSAVELAQAYYVAQASLARRTADRVQALWRELDARDLTGSWESLVGPRVVEAVAAGQVAAAARADPYIDAIERVDGGEPDGARVRAATFAGHASDGRPLDSLLYLPVITTKQSIAAGLGDVEAMMRGLNQMLKMAATQVTDAGRTAVGAGIAGRRTIQGYIRIAAAPCCARCAILAGKEFGWNRGFQRHLPPMRLHPHARDADRPRAWARRSARTAAAGAGDGRWRLLQQSVPQGAGAAVHGGGGTGDP